MQQEKNEVISKVRNSHAVNIKNRLSGDNIKSPLVAIKKKKIRANIFQIDIVLII